MSRRSQLTGGPTDTIPVPDPDAPTGPHGEEAPNAATRREIAAIAAASSTDRTKLIGDFIARREQLFVGFARSMTRRYGIPDSQVDDVAQTIREATYMLLVGGDMDRWLNSEAVFEAQVFVTAKSKVRDEYDSAAHTPASGMTSRMRRGRRIADTRDRLRDALGREPEQQEIIDHHNTEAVQRRSDAARQGMILTAEDFERVRAVPLDERDDRANDMADDSLISAIEGKDLVMQTIAEARNRAATGGHPKLGEVAHAWLGGAMAELPCILTNREVAEQVGISYEVSRQLVNKCREIAADIAVNRYGYAAI